MRLKDKITAITGAGRGIGLAAAELFAREGARVALLEIDDKTGVEAEKLITRAGGRARFIKTDIGDVDSVQKAFAAIEDIYGGLDVLYNNASVFSSRDDGPVSKISLQTWHRIVNINLNGLFYCCKYGIPRIVKSGGGSVVNTGSSASVMGIPGCDAYTSTKGAVVSLTRSMAVEFGQKGVRVNCIVPAGIDTEMLRESSTDNPDFDAKYFFSRAPMGRFGRPGEVASLALFLASDESSYINGAIIRADGAITVTPIS